MNEVLFYFHCTSCIVGIIHCRKCRQLKKKTVRAGRELCAHLLESSSISVHLKISENSRVITAKITHTHTLRSIKSSTKKITNAHCSLDCFIHSTHSSECLVSTVKPMKEWVIFGKKGTLNKLKLLRVNL